MKAFLKLHVEPNIMCNNVNQFQQSFNLFNNKVNGNWGAWTSFGTCSKTCASGTQTRTRLCNNPAPANGGAACVGSASESKTCNTQVCTSQTGSFLCLQFSG